MRVLDKEEFKIKLEEINRLVEEKDYKGAMNVVDSIDWRRVKNVRTLCVVGEIYAANKRYEDSRDIFLLAYHRASIGKNILYRLVEVTLKMGRIDEAIDYYEEFKSVAPNDNTSYVLNYKILKAKNAPLQEQIRVLEEYKEKEFTEKWSYELANLYYRAGEKEKCKDLCNEMILWFSDGSYVMKALDLKMRMGVMTASDKEKYQKEMTPKLKTVEEYEKEKELKEKKETVSDEDSEDDDKEESSEISDENQEPDEIKESEESYEEEEEKEDTQESEEETEPDENEEESGEDSGESPEEEAPEEDITFDDVFDSASSDEKEDLYIESIETKDERDLSAAETLQERFSKGLRDLLKPNRKTLAEAKEETRKKKKFFGGFRNDEDVEDEDDLSDDFDVIPSLEDEEEVEKKNRSEERKNATSVFKMPEFKIPASMRKKKKEEETEPELQEEEQEEPEVMTESEEPEVKIAAVKKKKPAPVVKKDIEPVFNLEDTILAAATAQGIDIPMDEKEEEEPVPVPAEEENEEEILKDDLSEVSEISGITSEEDGPEIEENDVDEKEESEESEEFEETTEDGEEDSDMIIAEENPDEDDEDDAEESDIPDLNDKDFIENLEKVTSEEEEEFEASIRKNRKVKEVKILKQPEEDDEDLSEEFDEEDSDTDSEEDEYPEEEYEDEEYSEEDEIERFINEKNGVSDIGRDDMILRDEDLTDEEVKLFSYFVNVPGMRKQILDTLKDVQQGAMEKTSRRGNIIVMGGAETGKTRLISSLIPAICKELNLGAAKAAYVFAEQINGKDIGAIVEKLRGGFLVVEKANQLDKKTARALSQAMEQDTGGMIVIFEDDKLGMRKLIARYKFLSGKFTSTINIPVFTNDELAGFARVYAMENGYKIDNMGMLALYNMIGVNQKMDVPMNIGAVKEMLDEAIERSQRGFGIFRRNSRKKDREGYRILTEKDFK